MPGRKEQNKGDLKKASANCYQLDTFFKGIKKTVNESKNPFSEDQQSNLDDCNFNVDIEPGSLPPAASPPPATSTTPPVSLHNTKLSAITKLTTINY